MRDMSVLRTSLMAMILSLSSDLISPVLPPESMEAVMLEMFLKPAKRRALMMMGAPVPPPMVTIFIFFPATKMDYTFLSSFVGLLFHENMFSKKFVVKLWCWEVLLYLSS